MSTDRPNVVFVDKVTDREGFPCDLLEDPVTGARYLAYQPEVFWERGEHLQRQAAKTRRRAVSPGTPTQAWPARPPQSN